MDKPTRIIMQLNKADYQDYLKSQSCIPDVRVYVTDTVRGKAHTLSYNPINQYVTIPKHALNKSWDYFIYYIAHELAHVNDWNIFKNNRHGKTFFDCFQQLCPDNLQHYELSYKPSFGARIEHEHVYSTMLIKNGVKTFKCHYCSKTKS